MTIRKAGPRKEVIHALTSSALFREKAEKVSFFIANRNLEPVEKGMALFVTLRRIDELSVVQRHEATKEEIQKAFEALGRRSLKNSSTFSEPHW